MEDLEGPIHTTPDQSSMHTWIEKKSGLSKPVLFDQLVYLIKINVIKLKVDQNKEILFALRERLENK